MYKVQEKGFTHNHEPSQDASAHPSDRRVTIDDQKSIDQLTITGVKARQIKQLYKQQSAPNRPEPTKRDIYNVQAKMGQEMRKGLSRAEIVIKQLEELGWAYEFRQDSDARITELTCIPDISRNSWSVLRRR